MSVTLNDIAHRAGVSVSTVSRVLNKKSKKYRISAETEKLVNRAAKNLNYRPNQLARGLRLKKTHTIGLLVPDISNPFFAHITRIIQKNASDAGYSLIVCDTDENIKIELEQIDLLKSKGVDGFILMPVGTTHKYIDSLLKTSKPIVLLDRSFEDLEVDSVVVDNVTGSYNAIEHLIKFGHKRIAIIQGLPDTYTNNARVKGYLNALNDYNIALDERLIVGKDFRKENGYIETKFLLNLDEPPTAIFTTSDLITLGAFEAISEENLKIPEDISIVSFDDIDFAPFLNPPLTAVKQPKEMMGEVVVKMLIDRLKHKSNYQKKKIMLKSELIMRNSVKEMNGQGLLMNQSPSSMS
jgi:LacI family transcriptional regulator